MDDKQFERKLQPALGFGERRGPAAAEPLAEPAPGSREAALAERRGALADAEEDATFRALAPLAAGRRALVVGCGTGAGVGALLAAGAANVVGTDSDPRALELAARTHAAAGALFERAEPEALPFAAGSFGLVICVGALEESPGTAPVLAELRRVLEPGGLLAVSVAVARQDEALADPALVFANRELYARRASLGAALLPLEREPDDGAGPELDVAWLGTEPAERRSVLIVASDESLPRLAPTASLIGMRELADYRATVDAWEQRARRAEADGAAKHWELVASREAQRRLRKRLWHLEHRPLRRIFRLLTGQPWKLSEGPPIRPPERESEPWS